MICRPYLWVKGTDIVQYYYEAPSISSEGISVSESMIFCMKYPSIFSSEFVGSTNKVTIEKVFRPYYKLLISLKAIPIYKSIDPSSEISLSIKMKDNLTN